MSFEIAKVKVGGGTDVKDVIDVRVDAAMSATTTCDITIAASRTGSSEAEMVPNGIVIGADIEVTGLGAMGNFARVFKGVITGLSVEIDDALGEFVAVRAADKSFKLWLGSVGKAYVNQSHADTVSTIARSVGLSADVGAGALGDAQLPHQLQSTSNGEYLRLLMAKHGAYWTVSDSKLEVRKFSAEPADSTTIKYGVDLRRMRVRLSGMAAAKSASVRAWDPATQKVITSASTDKSAVLGTGMQNHLSKIETLPGDAPAYLHHPVDSQNEGTALATSMRVREMAERVQVRIERVGGDSIDKLYPGAGVDVQNVGSDIAGKYRIAAVTHICNSDGWRSIITTGTPEPATFAELAGTDGGRGLPWTQRGPVVGIVSNNADPDHPGMVKVKLGVVSEDVESAWARVVSPGAGKSRGFQVMPAVGDEVLVAFEQGEASRPFVLGGLWNKDNNPAPLPQGDKYADNGAVHTWQITSTDGQRITVTDGNADDKKFIQLALKDSDVHLHVGMDKVELWAKKGKTLEVKSGDGSMLLDDQGNVTLKGGTITIKATQDVSIEGVNINLKATANLKAEGAAGAEISGKGPSKFEAAGPLTLKGAIVQIN